MITDQSNNVGTFIKSHLLNLDCSWKSKFHPSVIVIALPMVQRSHTKERILYSKIVSNLVSFKIVSKLFSLKNLSFEAGQF
jgi:hypothetical protein